MHLLPLTLASFALLTSAHPAKTTTTTATSPFATRPPASQCGGFAPQINPCPSPLVCAPTQPPMSNDFPGTCVLATCGGKSPFLDPCPSGQVCVYNATAPMTDLPGRCMASKLTCGGKEKCKSGWDCASEPKIRIDYNYRDEFPEGKGICIPPGSLVVREPWSGWGK
ncbi:hypothetical protein QBC34DRAFT_432053 [Podospora aff. communis PSN243]|uniref:Uncharacterized protein n=1 Tax=Podospora aff. communis PSN243 TaxID=3040156 RepID=A0AAV9FYN9_9PEZI|nr:hypothetical protein QBC34DRAFT_432053 [Podospora aff. communis PSN243]